MIEGKEEIPLITGGNDSLVKKPVKVYEGTEEYKTAFLTRAKLVRTPPRK